eukprot:16376-Heterococcus_DN1.PRE.2
MQYYTQSNSSCELLGGALNRPLMLTMCWSRKPHTAMAVGLDPKKFPTVKNSITVTLGCSTTTTTQGLEQRGFSC